MGCHRCHHTVGCNITFVCCCCCVAPLKHKRLRLKMRRAESSREQLLQAGDAVCPKFLSSMASPKGHIGDHIMFPVWALEQEVATLEIFFAAPIITDVGSRRVPHAASFPPSRRCWYDLCVHPKRPATSASPPGPNDRRSQRVAYGDFSWLRLDLKPAELTALEGYGSSEGVLPPGTQQWRVRVVMLLSQWVRNAWLIREFDQFVNIVGMHERLAFEYHSFLCGVGDTALPWDTAVMRSQPMDWIELHPRVLVVMDSSSSPSPTTGGPTKLRCRIPLLRDADVAARVQRQLSLWLDLRGKLLSQNEPSGSDCRMMLVANLQFDLGLASAVAYRVENERVRASFEVSNTLESHLLTRNELQLSSRCNLSGDLVYLNSNSSPALSPRASGAVGTAIPKQGQSGIPSFSALHRAQNATIMEYLPQLEDSIIEQCVDTPVHYLSFLWALTEHFGKPIEFSTSVWDERGVEDDKRSAVFIAPAMSELHILVQVQYRDGKALPTVKVWSPGMFMPGTNQPLSTPVRLHEGALLFSSSRKLFNVQTMAQNILDGVNVRCTQMLQIIQITRDEDQAKVLAEESDVRGSLLGTELDVRATLQRLEVDAIEALRPPPATAPRQVPSHADPVMDLLSSPPSRASVTLFVEQDFMSDAQPLVRTREAVRREDTAFPRRTAETTSPLGDLDLVPAALELSEPHRDADGNETPVQHTPMDMLLRSGTLQDPLVGSYRGVDPVDLVADKASDCSAEPAGQVDADTAATEPSCASGTVDEAVNTAAPVASDASLDAPLPSDDPSEANEGDVGEAVDTSDTAAVASDGS